jgi:hypothetical protein
MKLITKTMVSILMALAASSVFADKVIVKFNKSAFQEIYTWEFIKKDDGRFFLLGPESTNALVIHVNKMYHGAVADPVTVKCNDTSYHVEPDASITCYGNFDDIISMYTEPNDFKNGSEGTYALTPLNN